MSYELTVIDFPPAFEMQLKILWQGNAAASINEVQQTLQMQ